MRFSISAALTAGLTTFAAIGITPARADVIFNSFGTGGSFNHSLEYTVSGPDSSLGSAALSPAAGFTPTGDYDLSEIDVAVENVSGTNSAVVSLWTDSSGATGTQLGSWDISNQPAGPDAVTAITGITGILLTSGDTYFLEVAPGANDTYDGWFLGNDLSDIGPLYDPPVDLADSTGPEAAYELIGEPVAVPEPAAVALFGSGLLGLGFARRRKRALSSISAFDF